MFKKIAKLSLICFVIGFFSCSGKINKENHTTDSVIQGPDTPNHVLVDTIKNREFIISSYVRTPFYLLGRVDHESLRHCNDIIYIGLATYSNGDIYFDCPNNTGTFKGNAVQMNNFEGHNGVISFDGNSEMNAHTDILNNAERPSNSFTFATWIYIDNWTKGGKIFYKQENSSNKYVSFELGDSQGNLVLDISGRKNKITAAGLLPNSWHYIGMQYNNKHLLVQIDGNTTFESKTIAGELPFRGDMIIGRGLNAKLDNTTFFGIPVSPSYYMNRDIVFKGDWGACKLVAFWKWDDPNNPGLDSQTWENIINGIRATLQGKKAYIRVCVANGDWRTMIKSDVNRKRFANNVKELLEKYNLDGVDIDFEWPTNNKEFRDVSEAFRCLKLALPTKIVSPTLHPVAYKIDKDVANMVDWISIQCYGPFPERYLVNKFKSDMLTILRYYGCDPYKLVSGLPFIGAYLGSNSNPKNRVEPAAYFEFVKDGLVHSPEQNELEYKGKRYRYDGIDNIKEKTRWTKHQLFRGVMSWDLATDVPYENRWSLLKAMDEAANEK